MSEPRWELTFWGKIVKVERTEMGYAVGIDMKDMGNCVWYVFMEEKPKGSYLKYYVAFNVPKPIHRIEIE